VDVSWYLGALAKYGVFSGRARRREFWMFTLVNFIVGLVLSIPVLFGRWFMIIPDLYSLAVLIPSFAVGCRRLHDIGRTGWWQLIVVIPVIGTIVLIVFWVLDGQPGPNKYGPNPKFVG
jgi:uncharacterized membrane protein YhaH (DUF805 family)